MRQQLSKYSTALAIILPLLSGANDGRCNDDPPLREAVECSTRQGLPNWFAKAAAGGQLRVAYLGGSITAQPGWRVKTLKWFQQQYPDARVTEINAAIGGTGSMLGAFRLQQDVLQHHPDLLFVEFAVNDAGAPPDQLRQTMEGIVRQTWLSDPTIDICFVYTLTEGMLGDLQHGKFPRAASVMEEVADHYGIPSIHMGLQVARLEAAEKLVFTAAKTDPGESAGSGKIVFSGDGVHPYPETGHQVYFEAIQRSFEKLQGVGKPDDHCVCTPLVGELWQRAKIAPLTAARQSGGWQKLPADHPLAKRFANRLPTLWMASEPGTSLTFQFTGTHIGFYDLLGPDCGQVTVSIDGGQPQTRARFDGYCTYHRLAMLMVASNLENTRHTVTVTVASEPPDKASILHTHRRPDLEKNPDKYDGTNWYVGGILLIGEPEQAASGPTEAGSGDAGDLPPRAFNR